MKLCEVDRFKLSQTAPKTCRTLQCRTACPYVVLSCNGLGHLRGDYKYSDAWHVTHNLNASWSQAMHLNILNTPSDAPGRYTSVPRTCLKLYLGPARVQSSHRLQQQGPLRQEMLAAPLEHGLRVLVHLVDLVVEGGGVGADQLNVRLQLVQRAVLPPPQLQAKSAF